MCLECLGIEEKGKMELILGSKKDIDSMIWRNIFNFFFQLFFLLLFLFWILIVASFSSSFGERDVFGD